MTILLCTSSDIHHHQHTCQTLQGCLCCTPGKTLLQCQRMCSWVCAKPCHSSRQSPAEPCSHFAVTTHRQCKLPPAQQLRKNASLQLLYSCTQRMADMPVARLRWRGAAAPATPAALPLVNTNRHQHEKCGVFDSDNVGLASNCPTAKELRCRSAATSVHPALGAHSAPGLEHVQVCAQLLHAVTDLAADQQPVHF